MRPIDNGQFPTVQSVTTPGPNPYAELKESGLGWAGKIPSHWTIKRIKDIAELKSGEQITSENIAPVGDYPVFGGNGFRGYTTSYTHEGQYVLIGRQGAL